MTEQEWLACADPTPMLKSLRCTDRKLRLFAVACCRRIDSLLTDSGRNAIASAEAIADFLNKRHEYDGLSLFFSEVPADQAAGTANGDRWDYTFRNFITIEDAIRSSELAISAVGASFDADRGARYRNRLVAAEKAAQVALAGDIFGNPFRSSPPLPSSVLNWNDRTIPRIAQGIYEDRRMPEGTFDNSRLLILADALLDAGCEDEALIEHCRQPEVHVRGCWAVDLILGKV